MSESDNVNKNFVLAALPEHEKDDTIIKHLLEKLNVLGVLKRDDLKLIELDHLMPPLKIVQATKLLKEASVAVSSDHEDLWKKVLDFLGDREHLFCISQHPNINVLRDKEYNLKDAELYIFYSAEDETPLRFHYCSSTKESSSGQNQPAVILQADLGNHSLVAHRYCEASVFFKSHRNIKGGEIELGEKKEIHNLKEVNNILNSEKGIKFNPAEAQLCFRNSSGKDAFVTIRSIAACDLFVSLVQCPFDGLYQPLHF